MPKIRLRVQRLMIATAIVAVPLWAGILWNQSAKYRAIAAEHALTETYWSTAGSQATKPLIGGGSWT
jgi:hypothetical protein